MGTQPPFHQNQPDLAFMKSLVLLAAVALVALLQAGSASAWNVFPSYVYGRPHVTVYRQHHVTVPHHPVVVHYRHDDDDDDDFFDRKKRSASVDEERHVARQKRSADIDSDDVHWYRPNFHTFYPKPVVPLTVVARPAVPAVTTVVARPYYNPVHYVVGHGYYDDK